MSGNRLAEAQAVFRAALHALLLVPVASDSEAKEVSLYAPQVSICRLLRLACSGATW